MQSLIYSLCAQTLYAAAYDIQVDCMTVCTSPYALPFGFRTLGLRFLALDRLLLYSVAVRLVSLVVHVFPCNRTASSLCANDARTRSPSVTSALS